MFRIEYDDEMVTFFVNDKEVGYADHDLHGWEGMDLATDLFKNVAVALKVDLVDG